MNPSLAGWAIAAAVLGSAPLAARDLQPIPPGKGQAVFWLDRDSVRAVPGTDLREAIVSTDDRRSPAAGGQVGTDSLFQVDCPAARFRIAWTRFFGRDLVLLREDRPLAPRALRAAAPGNEARIVAAICNAR